MQTNPFGFLLDLTEAEGRQWLAHYLLGETTVPAVQVPFDLQRLEFILGEVNPLPDETLPVRIGDLAGGLLAEAIIQGAHRTGDVRFLSALFTLLESLPVSEKIEEFLNDLVVSGRLLAWPGGEGIDFHLLTLRALVLHQRPVEGHIGRLIQLWKREAWDLRYASTAIQGLLRVSISTAIDALPDFVDRALTAQPPRPLANTLFAVSVALGDDKSMWERLVRVFDGHTSAFEAVKEGFLRTRLTHANPVAWQALRAAVPMVLASRGGAPVMSMADTLSRYGCVSTDCPGPWERAHPASEEELPLLVTSGERQVAYRARG